MAGSPTQRNPRNRAAQDEASFRPHQRYPRLNADAGKEEIPVRGRRPVRRSAAPVNGRREATPKASIRLDSTVDLPAPPLVRTNRTRPGTRRGRSQGLAINFNPARLLSLAAMVVLLGVGYWFLNSPGFYISKVELTGNRLLQSEEVVKVTGVDKINVFGLNEEEVAAKIKTLPYILQASVSKALPDKLAVTVTERKSILNWRIGGYS
jgi:hypothetical protein